MGPLAGFRILELESIGPVPFCGMLLADMGADVLLVDRPEDPRLGFDRERRPRSITSCRRSVTLDLKTPDGVDAALALVANADALIEGFRPGVLERLNLSPERLLVANPALVIGRMTGYGQTGPLAARAGHDIDYIALAGALHAIGHAGRRPVPPLNLVGDFGGGGMLLGLGVLAGLLESQRSKTGQVIDAAMLDGAALLTTMFWGMAAAGQWHETRGDNVLDSGAPWYDTYETLDGRHVAFGAIEPKFYARMLAGLGLAEAALPDQHDRAGWPLLRDRFAAVIRTRTREQWCTVFDATDACFAPVLAFSEARAHPHSDARHGYVEVAGVVQPAPAPRFSRTSSAITRPPPERGEGGRTALLDWGFSSADIAGLCARGMGLEPANPSKAR